MIGQPRSSQRYVGRKAENVCRLAERMVELSRENPRYGYRRVCALLRRKGWPVNKKRVHRPWRQEGLKVPEKQRKKRRLLMGERERMHEEAGRAQRPRLELRLRYGPDRGGQKAEDDASGG